MIRPLLIIRPEPGNASTAARAKAFELDTRSMPLFAVRPIAWVPPDADPYVGVLFTSANAVRTAGPELTRYFHLPAFAVGGTTARLARHLVAYCWLSRCWRRAGRACWPGRWR